jgi:hypothetical protein
MYTGIYVFPSSASVTITTGQNTVLTRFGDLVTIASFVANVAQTVSLPVGIYRIISSTAPSVGYDAEKVIAHGKDGDPDPTGMTGFSTAFPGVTFTMLKPFLSDPDLKSFPIAANAI